MATIGTFTQTKDGFTGTIRTLALNVKAKIVPDEHKSNEAAPGLPRLLRHRRTWRGLEAHRQERRTTRIRLSQAR